MHSLTSRAAADQWRRYCARGTVEVVDALRSIEVVIDRRQKEPFSMLMSTIFFSHVQLT
jgi:hypothetical protein